MPHPLVLASDSRVSPYDPLEGRTHPRPRGRVLARHRRRRSSRSRAADVVMQCFSAACDRAIFTFQRLKSNEIVPNASLDCISSLSCRSHVCAEVD